MYDLFPTAVGVTTAFVFFLIGISFWSIAIPIRAIVTIAMTLAFVYGCSIWVYQVSEAAWCSVFKVGGGGGRVLSAVLSAVLSGCS